MPAPNIAENFDKDILKEESTSESSKPNKIASSLKRGTEIVGRGFPNRGSRYLTRIKYCASGITKPKYWCDIINFAKQSK